jgi:hypothetical protein
MSDAKESPIKRRGGPLWILGLILTASILDGLLSGGNVDRLLVATPAWNHLGPTAWAEYSRYADLGYGIIVYPTMAICGTAASVFAAIIFVRDARSVRGVGFPIVLAAVLMLAALPLSLLATPFMLSLRHIDDGNWPALASAFSGAHYWGRLQAIFHVAAFFANLWSIAAVAGRNNACN